MRSHHYVSLRSDRVVFNANGFPTLWITGRGDFDTFYLFLCQRFIGLTLDLQSFRFILFSKFNLLAL